VLIAVSCVILCNMQVLVEARAQRRAVGEGPKVTLGTSLGDRLTNNAAGSVIPDCK
jgi:hypothetical protein